MPDGLLRALLVWLLDPSALPLGVPLEVLILVLAGHPLSFTEVEADDSWPSFLLAMGLVAATVPVPDVVPVTSLAVLLPV